MQLWEDFTLQVFLMKLHNTPTHLYQGQGKKHSHDSSKTYAKGTLKKRYVASWRSIENIPPVRRDLIKREKYFVPNSLVVSRGCPHHCDFCYKDASIARVNRFTPERQTMPQLKLIVCLADIFISLTIIFQVILTSHQNYLKVCAVWVEFFRVPLLLQQY